MLFEQMEGSAPRSPLNRPRPAQGLTGVQRRVVAKVLNVLPGTKEMAASINRKCWQTMPTICGVDRPQYAPRKTVTTVRAMISTSNQIDQLSI